MRVVAILHIVLPLSAETIPEKDSGRLILTVLESQFSKWKDIDPAPSFNDFPQPIENFILTSSIDLYDSVNEHLRLTLLDEMIIWDPSAGPPPWTWWLPYLKKVDHTKTKTSYEKWRSATLDLQDAEKMQRTESFILEIQNNILSEMKDFSPFSFSLQNQLRHDSNVVQAPDDQIIVSEKAGVSNQVDFKIFYNDWCPYFINIS